MPVARRHTTGSHLNRMRMVMRNASRKSFAIVEDREDSVQYIHKIAGLAVKEAARQNKRHGLTAIVVRGREVVQISPGKKEKVIAVIEENKKQYKPGQVLYARKD